MSRLADYFVVCGIDRDSKNGKMYFVGSRLRLLQPEMLWKHLTPLEVSRVSY